MFPQLNVNEPGTHSRCSGTHKEVIIEVEYYITFLRYDLVFMKMRDMFRENTVI